MKTYTNTHQVSADKLATGEFKNLIAASFYPGGDHKQLFCMVAGGVLTYRIVGKFGTIGEEKTLEGAVDIYNAVTGLETNAI